MDQQLKQRLIGVTIVVALVVIFVPMLFEKSDEKGKFGNMGIPSIPEDVMEKSIELPKTAEDIAPKEEDEKTPVETGYKIVPLHDEPPTKSPPNPKEKSATTANPDNAGDENKTDSEWVDKPAQESAVEDEKRDIQPDDAAIKLAPLNTHDSEKPETAVKRLVHTIPTLAPKNKLPLTAKPQRQSPEPDDGVDVRHSPAISTSAKAENTGAKHAKPSTSFLSKPSEVTERKSDSKKKPLTTKTPTPPSLKTVVNRQKLNITPSETNRDLDEEPVPVPAKPVNIQVKPKTAVVTSPKPSSAKSVDSPKKSNPVKPAESSRPAVRVDKPEPITVDDNPAPIKPKVSKPAESEHPAIKPEKQDSAATAPHVKPKVSKPAVSEHSSVKPESTANDANPPPAKPKIPKTPPAPKPAKPAEQEKPKPQTMAPGERISPVGIWTRQPLTQDFPDSTKLNSF